MSHMILSPSHVEATVARREELVRTIQQAELAARSRATERTHSRPTVTLRGLVRAALMRLGQRRQIAPNLTRPTTAPAGKLP